MYTRLVPVDKKNHATACIKALPSYAHAAGEHLVPVLPAELASCHALFPIVFLEGQQVEPGPFLLLGPSRGRNLFVSPEGKWGAPYIPAALRRYPFALAAQEGREEMIVCVDQDSGAVVEGDGERLFDDEGNAGPALTRAMQFLKEFQTQAQAGAALGNLLRELDLLAPVTVSVQDGDARKQVRLEGVMAVDEQKLNKLEDEAFLRLRRAGALPLVYMHLLSLRMLQTVFRTVVVSAPAENPLAALEEPGGEDVFDFSKI